MSEQLKMNMFNTFRDVKITNVFSIDGKHISKVFYEEEYTSPDYPGYSSYGIGEQFFSEDEKFSLKAKKSKILAAIDNKVGVAALDALFKHHKHELLKMHVENNSTEVTVELTDD